MLTQQDDKENEGLPTLTKSSLSNREFGKEISQKKPLTGPIIENYSKDILLYLQTCCSIHKPSHEYMSFQPEINEHMRKFLIE